MEVDEAAHIGGPNSAASASTTASKSRERVEEEYERRYNVELQESLLEEGLKVPGKERAAFEAFLDIFPTAGPVWKRYVQFELDHSHLEAAEELFKRCLVASVNVELWKLYLDHTMKVSENLKIGPMERKKMMKDAFEYALGHIGLDVDATVIWEEYLAWKRREGFDPTAVCDIFARALSIPMHGLDRMWRDFEKFIEKLPRPPSTTELVAKFSTAKRVFEDRIKQTEGLTKNALARPPRRYRPDSKANNAASHTGAAFSSTSSFSDYSTADGTSSSNADSNQSTNDFHQTRLWKQLIEFEKANPQDLDENKLAERVTFTFNQALVALYHYPEIWHQSAQYQLSIGKVEECKKVYASALKVLPQCLILYFEFAEFLELNNFSKESDVLYKSLVKTFFPDNELVWIQYLYYSRRVHGIQAARKVFFKLRKLSNVCSHHSYVAAAQLEYYVNKDPHVARKVFELGYQLYEREPMFLTHYVDFLYHQSEDSHMRVLFEKILANLPPSQSLELWNRFIKFETICGNLEPAAKLQTRRSHAFPGMDPSGILAAVQRYRFLDLWPVSEAELSSFDNAFEMPEDGSAEDEYAQDSAFGTHDSRGTNASSNGSSKNAHENAGSKDGASGSASHNLNTTIVMPDLKQMQLYKGTGVAGQSATSATLSFRLDELMGRLPSARDWSGPMVNIELLMQSILNFIEIPNVPMAAHARQAALKFDVDEEESGLQARARESAMSGEQFVHKMSARAARG